MLWTVQRISDSVEELVTLFRELPNAKLSFATKFVNRSMLQWNHGGRTRIRFSLNVLWRPDLQESKTSSNGFNNVRYRSRAKAATCVN